MVKVSVGTITLTRVIGPVVAKVEMSLDSSELLSYYYVICHCLQHAIEARSRPYPASRMCNPFPFT